jgi:hypothetical protein
LVTIFAAGCSGAPRDGADSSSESASALRTLDDSEKVGSIAYGDTKTVSYTGVPLYRALSFSAHAGDSVDLWVRSTSGDARAWLVNPSWKTIASNDDAGGGTKNSHIATTIGTDGTHWIVFREADREDATFNVSLSGSSSNDDDDPPPPPPPPPDDSAFVSNCSAGTAGGNHALSDWFTPGATRANEVGNFSVAGRYRRCTAATGCAPWQRDDSILVHTQNSKSFSSGVIDLAVDTGNSSQDPFFWEVRPNLAGLGISSVGWTCKPGSGVCRVGNAYLTIKVGNDQNFVLTGNVEPGPAFDDFSVQIGAKCFFKLFEAVETVNPQERIEAQVALSGRMHNP